PLNRITAPDAARLCAGGADRGGSSCAQKGIAPRYRGGHCMDNAPIGRLVRGLAATMAVLGGVALIAATLITGLSVIGRALIPVGLSAIPGDVELVQGTVFFAVMAFMPWCHLERGQAIVAILTDRFPTRFNAMLEF